MKVVMINDCASVGENLLKYIPPHVEKQYLHRTRGLWSKTFGIALDIAKSKGDIYHSNYLLQDCYIASRIGKKPLVGYALGSDLRRSLKHSLWGRIVRHNLKKCDRLWVSTPDILEIAKRYRPDVEYLPPLVDCEHFFPRPFSQEKKRKKILIASNSNWTVKGTDIAVKALGMIKDKVAVSIIEHGLDFERTLDLASSIDLHLEVLPKVPHQTIREYYWDADVVLDQFRFGCPGMITLEAIACGRPVVTFVDSKFKEYADFPLKQINNKTKVARAIMNVDFELWEKQNRYLKANHKKEVIINRVLKTYSSLL